MAKSLRIHQRECIVGAPGNLIFRHANIAQGKGDIAVDIV
jgi:hypothetical protein